MIDLLHLEKYQENNRIEAKKALGGLPRSLWETYSAFANTLGGVILLGVEECKDKSLRAVDLPEPEKLVAEFWEIVQDKNKVSVNLLKAKHVKIEEIDGKHIIVITIPRAKRAERPVYVGGNACAGTYLRNGEGDYKCSRDEVQKMFLERQKKTSKDNLNAHMVGSICDWDGENKCHICIKKQAVIDYLTEKVVATELELQKLGIKQEELHLLLLDLVQDGIVEKVEKTKKQATMYQLKGYKQDRK